MDATPVTLGQEFGGYAASMQYGIERLTLGAAADRRAALGGTAVGTGIKRAGRTRRHDHRQAGAGHGLPLTEAVITSRRRAPATRWSRRAGCCGRSR